MTSIDGTGNLETNYQPMGTEEKEGNQERTNEAIHVEDTMGANLEIENENGWSFDSIIEIFNDFNSLCWFCSYFRLINNGPMSILIDSNCSSTQASAKATRWWIEIDPKIVR